MSNGFNIIDLLQWEQIYSAELLILGRSYCTVYFHFHSLFPSVFPFRRATSLSSLCFSRSARSFVRSFILYTVYQLRSFLSPRARARWEGGRKKQSCESGEHGIQAQFRISNWHPCGVAAESPMRRQSARFCHRATYARRGFSSLPKKSRVINATSDSRLVIER